MFFRSDAPLALRGPLPWRPSFGLPSYVSGTRLIYTYSAYIPLLLDILPIERSEAGGLGLAGLPP